MNRFFVPSRLQMARSIRGLTATALSREVDVSPEWLSKVERNRTTPSDELVARTAHALNLPTRFFYRDNPTLPESDEFHFRASSRLAQKDESAARALASLASELSEWMDATYELPTPGIPDLQELTDIEMNAGPEVAAESLRSHWGLGTAPVKNMVAMLEAKGARVFSVSGTYQAIDAFSFRHNGKAVIFLNPTKTAERLRFDLAHELGHLIMHGGTLLEPDRKVRERQANDFASAFLMPRGGMLGTLRGNITVDQIPILRDEWRVSGMAVAVRLHQLGVITDWTYRLICQELARRGFRRSEPGSKLIPESSSLWSQVLADLREQKLGFPYLADLLDVRPADVRSLLVGLVPMALEGDGRSGRFSSGADLRLVSN
ncbi:helix-turn-helix domain-containing protein [Isoptericola sp. NPDC058082]|uniref:helix-turn-helix domain-containing protein n=1 Tax=Isoptericola sp. NPDC058082 TaxID=3346331 RepID=UPI0036E1EB64